MSSSTGPGALWERALADVIDAGHLVVAERLSAVLDDAVGPLGLDAELLVADTAQRVLIPLHPEPREPVDIGATVPGRAYQYGDILEGTAEDGGCTVWIPVLDGMDRLGVLRIGLDARPVPRIDGVRDDPLLHRRLWTLAGLAGHVLAAKSVYSDRVRRRRSRGPISAPSELLWQMMLPRTAATERLVVSAVLEPHRDVAGDAYDYSVEGDRVDLAVFDAAGHDLRAGTTAALAVTGTRNARRDGERDLRAVADRAHALIATQPGPPRFATAVLAALDTASGVLEYLNAGHVPPLLVRRGKVVKELSGPHRVPLGVATRASDGLPPVRVAREQLEPGDQLLMYSDGVTEARDAHGAFFGEDRLVELTERAAADRLPAPETLRRLAIAVLDHQDGRLQDDATLLLVEWSHTAHLRMIPSFTDG
ncbi:PP2C family protein-serine/threonine phosphatase [Pseudonocardia humida]|uniref:Serine/threonine-protein phosphatase n=1 Tax=Pseudonocardia humida TaxID=2800819 RepID=A0ABT0ZXI1_9PSEU|nr:PP2C family protein-serine/threonine phosphatase [Pseudonocardia humida]MCO1655450.1 serine/threonine-protein phosphatase [Pseudonocardia humida]